MNAFRSNFLYTRKKPSDIWDGCPRYRLKRCASPTRSGQPRSKDAFGKAGLVTVSTADTSDRVVTPCLAARSNIVLAAVAADVRRRIRRAAMREDPPRDLGGCFLNGLSTAAGFEADTGAESPGVVSRS